MLNLLDMQQTYRAPLPMAEVRRCSTPERCVQR